MSEPGPTAKNVYPTQIRRPFHGTISHSTGEQHTNFRIAPYHDQYQQHPYGLATRYTGAYPSSMEDTGAKHCLPVYNNAEGGVRRPYQSYFYPLPAAHGNLKGPCCTPFSSMPTPEEAQSYPVGCVSAYYQDEKAKLGLPLQEFGDLEILSTSESPLLGNAGPVVLYVLGKQILYKMKVVSAAMYEKTIKERQFDNFIANSNRERNHVMLIHDNHAMTDPLCILGYLCKLQGETGRNAYMDYINDSMAHMLCNWLSALHDSKDLESSGCQTKESESKERDDSSRKVYFQVRTSFFEAAEKMISTAYRINQKLDTRMAPKDDELGLKLHGMGLEGWKFLLTSLLLDDITLSKEYKVDPNLLENYEGLKEIFKKITALPLIKASLLRRNLSGDDCRSGREIEYQGIEGPCTYLKLPTSGNPNNAAGIPAQEVKHVTQFQHKQLGAREQSISPKSPLLNDYDQNFSAPRVLYKNKYDSQFYGEGFPYNTGNVELSGARITRKSPINTMYTPHSQLFN